MDDILLERARQIDRIEPHGLDELRLEPIEVKAGTQPDDDDHHQAEIGGSMRQFPKVWMRPSPEAIHAGMPARSNSMKILQAYTEHLINEW
jgi:hypothetical protein